MALRERIVQLMRIVGDVAPNDEIDDLCLLPGGGSKFPAEGIGAAKTEALRHTD
jgi:hypothetical protein